MNNGALSTFPYAADFFDTTRSTTHPDIGAIEFTPYSHNDTCYNAELIAKGTFYGSTEVATHDSVNTCDTTPGSIGVWYEYHAKGGYSSFSLCGYGTNFDAKMSLYSGICLNI